MLDATIPMLALMAQCPSMLHCLRNLAAPTATQRWVALRPMSCSSLLGILSITTYLAELQLRTRLSSGLRLECVVVSSSWREFASGVSSYTKNCKSMAMLPVFQLPMGWTHYARTDIPSLTMDAAEMERYEDTVT